MIRPNPKVALILLSLSGLCLWLWAADDSPPEVAPASNLEALLLRDPFLPPNYEAGRPAPPPPQMPRAEPIDRLFRLTGLINLGGQQRFNFVDLKSGKGFWLADGEAADGLQVLSYDQAGQRVSVRHGAQTGWLELKRPDLPLSNPPPMVGATADPSNPIPPIPNLPEGIPQPPAVSPGREGSAPPAPPVRRRIIVPRQQNTGA